MNPNWIELVPVCTDVYVWQADLVCEDCGQRIIRRLEKEGVKDTGDSDDFPQGPYSDGGGESDTVHHCGMGDGCMNKVDIPDGRAVGCPLGNSLTSDGEAYLRETVTKDIVSDSLHKRRMGRLWASVYRDVLRDCRLVEVKTDVLSVAPSLATKLSVLKRQEKVKILPKGLTDCYYVYGAATSPELTLLWRSEALDDGNFSAPDAILLPSSEAKERSLRDMVEEAVSDGAWD